MNSEKEVLTFLQDEFDKAKSKNPSYSLRAFAKRLRVSPATLSGLLNRKLRVTRRAAEKIFQNLATSPDQKEIILNGLVNKNLSKGKKRNLTSDHSYNLVDMDQYHLIADWYYFAILSLSETKDFKDDPDWISKRLNIQRRQASKALKTLERLGLLERNTKGRLCWTGKHFRTTSNISNSAIRFSHMQGLELARTSLEQDDVLECDFTSMTMAMDPEKILEAKERIKIFRRELSQFLESGKKKEVYRLSVQLFPLTRGSEKN